MKEIDLTELIKPIYNINEITSLDGYNETEFEIIKTFVNKIKEYYKPEKGKVEWMDKFHEECFDLAEYLRENTYKEYFDNIKEDRKLTPIKMEEFAGLFAYYIYIPGHVVMELLFNRDNYRKDTDDCIHLYRYNSEKHSNNIPILRLPNITKENYFYFINI